MPFSEKKLIKLKSRMRVETTTRQVGVYECVSRVDTLGSSERVGG